MNFREQIIERLLVHLGEVETPRQRLQAFAADVIHLLDRLTEDRAYDAGVRQVLQRYADEWAEHRSRRLLEGREDGASDVVHEMLERQGRNRAVRALRRVLLDALEGRERPADDAGLFEDE